MTKTTTKRADLLQDKEIVARLLKEHAQLEANKDQLALTIKNEMDAYRKGIKALEEQLIAIGTRNIDQFDKDGNWVFDDGWLHEAKSTIIKTKRSFDFAEFKRQYPELVELKWQVKTIKSDWTDKELRKEYQSMGIELGTEKSIEVKHSKGDPKS
jgi:hypothetical protein